MDIPVEKNKEYLVEIIDNGYEGEGIAKINGFTVFVLGGIKGEVVKALIVKVLASHAFGKIIDIVKSSPNRIKSDCDYFKRCGGCDLRHIKYEETLKMKQNSVLSLANKMLKNKVDVLETVKMEEPYYYRNKVQYPVGISRDNKPVIGTFASRTHEIIPCDRCLIQNLEIQKVSKFIFNILVKNNISIYDEKKNNGLVRHIVTKIGIRTRDIMCIIVVNGDKIPKSNILVEEITKNFPNVKSIIMNVNKDNTNVILGKNNVILYGDGYIEDKLGDFLFKISPLSFYQVNPIQAEKLYNMAVEGANITKNDIVFDLYSGVGTIALFMARYAKVVYGIEIVNEAVEDANENARINNVENIVFFAGDVEEVLDDLINVRKIFPSIIMFDPPRRGLDDRSIQNIMKIKPKKLVYISCNPATLMRDLAKFEEYYFIKMIRPLDMFPWTKHVECCSVLYVKN